MQTIYADLHRKAADIRARVDALNPARLHVEAQTATGFELHLDPVLNEPRSLALDLYDKALGLYNHDRDDTQSDTSDPLLSAAMQASLRTASWGRVDDAYAEAQDSAKPALTSDDRPGAHSNAAGHFTDSRWADGAAAYDYARLMSWLDDPERDPEVREPLMPARDERVGGDAPTAEYDTPNSERMWQYVARALSGSSIPVSITIRGKGSWPTSRFLRSPGEVYLNAEGRERTAKGGEARFTQLVTAMNALATEGLVRRPRKVAQWPPREGLKTALVLRAYSPRERTYSLRAHALRHTMAERCPASRAYGTLPVAAPYGADLLALQMVRMKLAKRREWAKRIAS